MDFMSVAWILVFFSIQLVKESVEVSVIKPSQGFYMSNSEQICNRVKNGMIDLSKAHHISAVCLPVYLDK